MSTHAIGRKAINITESIASKTGSVHESRRYEGEVDLSKRADELRRSENFAREQA
jgi:hypothetical protein